MSSLKSKKKKKSYRPHEFGKPAGYSFMHELLASPTEPMPVSTQNAYFDLIIEALEEVDSELSVPHWNALSEMVNIMQTLVIQGLCEDAGRLVEDAVEALANAGRCHLDGEAMQLNPSEQSSVRAIAADFIEIAQVIPHRDMVRCHRATQIRIDTFKKNREVEVIDLSQKKATNASR